MLPTGRCRNCGIPSQNVLCDTCRNYTTCSRCYRYLPLHLYRDDDERTCNACRNRDTNNVGRYAHNRLIGDRTWTGNQDDISVSVLFIALVVILSRHMRQQYLSM